MESILKNKIKNKNKNKNKRTKVIKNRFKIFKCKFMEQK